MNTRETLSAFVLVEDDIEFIDIDRSTLERYATCPAQARLIESGGVLNDSLLAAAGEAVHQAFGRTISVYMDEPNWPVGELAEAAFGELRGARPDIQPEAIAAGRPSVWAWAKLIASIHPNNVLRYDGGEGDRSGQLSHEVPFGALRLRPTSEIDLLLTTHSPEVVCEIDYKSGWKKYSIDTVAASFQFQMHAWLILNNYPAIQAVQVKVWNCRTNDLSYGVMFDRKRLNEWDTRIRSALGEWHRYHLTLPQNAPTWPAIEKCAICPAAALCPSAGHVGDLASDPGGFVDGMVAAAARLEAMEKLAAEHVKATGKDLVSPSGAAFGFDKPIKSRRTKALYSIQHQPVDDDC
jgi:hypothetical protein